MELVDPERLISGCLAKKKQCQQLLYDTFYRFAMRICRRYTNNNYEAAEVMNCGFMKVFSNLHRYQPDRSFKGWIGRIMINTSLSYRRSNLKMAMMQDLDTAENMVHYELPDRNLLYQELINIIEKLPATEKTVFYLYALDGLSHKDISNRLAISIGSSKICLFRARRKLKKMIFEAGYTLHHLN